MITISAFLPILLAAPLLAQGAPAPGEMPPQMQDASPPHQTEHQQMGIEDQIKWLSLSPTPERRAALLDCYKRLVEYKRGLYQRAQVSYIDVLEAEAQHLQAQLAMGGGSEEQLEKNYAEQIRLAHERNDVQAELAARIKWLSLSPTPERRAALLDCYKRLVEYKRGLFQRAQVSYVDVLEAEAQYLQAQLAMGGGSEEQLEKNYAEQIRLAHERNDVQAELAARIKWLSLSPTPERRAALLDCYKRLVEYKRGLYQRAQISYDEVLIPEVHYLQAMIASLPRETQEKTEALIHQKLEELKQLYINRFQAGY